MKKGRKKATSSKTNRLSSGSSNTNESSDGESSSIKDEQLVPNAQESAAIRTEFAFSDLMRKMASKYQNNVNNSAADQ